MWSIWRVFDTLRKPFSELWIVVDADVDVDCRWEGWKMRLKRKGLAVRDTLDRIQQNPKRALKEIQIAVIWSMASDSSVHKSSQTYHSTNS